MAVVVDSRGGGDWNMEEGVELCALSLSLSVSVRAREQLRCDFLAILHAFLWHLVGAGAPWISLDLVLCFRVEAMRCFHLGACQVLKTTQGFKQFCCSTEEEKPALAAAKVVFPLSPARE